MKLSKLLENENFFLACEVSTENIVFTDVYACDLLSVAMANALEGNAFLTVIANLNTLAVASLLDLSCVILTQGVKPSDEFLLKALEEEIPVITTSLDTVSAIREIDKIQF